MTRQTKRFVNRAGPRYTPNLEPVAPNLVVRPIVDALSALVDTPEWKDEYLKEARGTAEAISSTSEIIRDDAPNA